MTIPQEISRIAVHWKFDYFVVSNFLAPPRVPSKLIQITNAVNFNCFKSDVCTLTFCYELHDVVISLRWNFKAQQYVFMDHI